MTNRTDADRPHPVSRAEFARRAGRAASSITEACAGPLRAASLPRGRINARHAAVIAWASKKGIDPASLLDPGAGAASVVAPTAAPATGRRGRGKPSREAAAATVAADVTSEPAIDGLLDLTLRQISDRYGNLQGFIDYVDARKKIADTCARELQNADSRGLVISREFVRLHVVSLIEGANLRLLSDTPKTLCRELYALAKSGAPLEEAERTARKLLGKQLESAASFSVVAA